MYSKLDIAYFASLAFFWIFLVLFVIEVGRPNQHTNSDHITAQFQILKNRYAPFESVDPETQPSANKDLKLWIQADDAVVEYSKQFDQMKTRERMQWKFVLFAYPISALCMAILSHLRNFHRKSRNTERRKEILEERLDRRRELEEKLRARLSEPVQAELGDH